MTDALLQYLPTTSSSLFTARLFIGFDLLFAVLYHVKFKIFGSFTFGRTRLSVWRCYHGICELVFFNHCVTENTRHSLTSKRQIQPKFLSKT